MSVFCKEHRPRVQAKGGRPFIARLLNLSSARSPAQLDQQKLAFFVPSDSSVEFATPELTKQLTLTWILQVVLFYFFSNLTSKGRLCFHRQCRISSTDCAGYRPNLHGRTLHGFPINVTSKGRIFTPQHREFLTPAGWPATDRICTTGL